MKNMPLLVESKYELPECWLFANKQYSHINKFPRRRTLPYVLGCDEEHLKDLGVPYRVVKEENITKYEYWDPKIFEEEELTLPLYVKLPEGYRNTGRSYTGKFVTEETVKAADAFADELLIEIQEHREMKKEEALYNSIEKALFEKAACGLHISQAMKENLVLGDKNLKLLPVRMPKWEGGSERTGWYAIFDTNKIEPDSVVTLEVPKGKEGLFVGTSGWQVKEWCKQLGLKRINVVSA